MIGPRSSRAFAFCLEAELLPLVNRRHLMKRTIRLMHTRGLKITLCLIFVLTTLLANAVIEPPVAHAQRYIVDISLGDNTVPSGTGTSVTINIGDDWIYDTYNTSATGFSLHAWVDRTDAIGTHVPSCHGRNWPSSRSITPNNDGNRMIITFRISGSCPLRGESGYTIRADVMARIGDTDTVVANRAIRFTVEGVPPTATPTETPSPTSTPSPRPDSHRDSWQLCRKSACAAKTESHQ